MDQNLNNNQKLGSTPFYPLPVINQQYTTPSYYIVYQAPYIPNPQTSHVYDLQINSQISQQLQNQTPNSFIQNNISYNNEQMSQPHKNISSIKLNVQTAQEKSNQFDNLHKTSQIKDLTNYQNLLSESHEIDSNYKNFPQNYISYNNTNKCQEKDSASNRYKKSSKIINQSEQFYNPDITLQNQIQDCQVRCIQETEQQIKDNTSESNEKNNDNEQINNYNKQLNFLSSQNQTFQRASSQYQQNFDKNFKSSPKFLQKMGIKNEQIQYPESRQKQHSEHSNCFSLNTFSYQSTQNHQQLNNMFQTVHNNQDSAIQTSQQHSKQCKYKQIKQENVKRFSILEDNQFTLYTKNFNNSQQSTEVKINSETKIDLEKTSITQNQSKILNTALSKNQEAKLQNSYSQQCSLKKDQVLKVKNKNKNKITKEKILKKLINGEPIKETSIIQNFQIQDAFDITKNSIFNSKKEMIFERKYSSQFILKISIIKNNEIIFASIKESRRNNRCQNKSITAQNPINLNTTMLQQDESSPKQDIQNEDHGQSNSSNINLQDNYSPSQINQLKSKKVKVSSRFHNLKKLFMYKLVATFTLNNMVELGVPEFLRDTLLKLIVRFKFSAKKSEEFNRKTEFFSQAHYNALFLFLNEQTICQLAKNKFEVYLHKVIFQIDLEKIAEYLQTKQISNNKESIFPYLNQSQKQADSFLIEEDNNYEDQIQYINILKRYCYQIVKSSNMFGVNNKMSKPIDDIDILTQNQEDKLFNEQENMRMAYTYRALQGISTLSKGIFVKKF